MEAAIIVCAVVWLAVSFVRCLPLSQPLNWVIPAIIFLLGLLWLLMGGFHLGLHKV